MSIFEEIRRRLDIVEVISEYLHLKRVGSSYSTNCPFHPDDTPSFYVSPSRQIWKCFGCGKGGDVIKFVAEYEGLSYLEAAKLLAERYNLDIDFGEGEKEERFYSALKKISRFYAEELKNSPNAKEFLLKVRKLPAQVVEDFKLGYAGDGFKSVEFAKREGIFEELLELKHFFLTSYGKYRDFFHGRVTIPVNNILSKVVGFGGRSLSEEQKPKYKNSPNSEVFQKERILFGIDRAKNYLRDRNFLIVSEGYFDIIRLHSVGLGNSVAPLGTALTRHHARVISKLTSKVVLLFDGDTAGRRAVISASKELLKFPVEVWVAFLPPGEDPDSFILQNGVRAIREIISSAKPLKNLLIESVKKASPEKREAYIRLFKEIVNEISDPIRRELWIKEFRDQTGLNPFGKTKKVAVRKVEPPPGLNRWEIDFLLGLLYLSPNLNLDDFKLSPTARELAEKILKGEEKDKLPQWLFQIDTLGLERRFSLAVEILSLEKPLLEETFEKLLKLERKIKEGKASREDLEQFRKLLSALEEGEKRLYKWYKEKVQTL
jgi:DNA primase